MRNVTVYRKTGQPPIHGEVGSMKAIEQKGNCVSLSNARIGDSPDVLRMVKVPWENVDIIVLDDTGRAVPVPKLEKADATDNDHTECHQANKPDHGADVPVKDVPATSHED